MHVGLDVDVELFDGALGEDGYAFWVAGVFGV